MTTPADRLFEVLTGWIEDAGLTRAQAATALDDAAEMAQEWIDTQMDEPTSEMTECLSPRELNAGARL